MSDITIRFSPFQSPPPGYRIEWWEQDEHYHWVMSDSVYSDIFADRWDAWRAAWKHSRSLQ